MQQLRLASRKKRPERLKYICMHACMKDLMLFMLVNWRITKRECERKLDLMKVWGVKVCDCCYDAGYRYAVPEFWSESELKEFRAKCRKHNQLVNFRIDPEWRKR